MQVDGETVNEVPDRKEYETIEVDCGEDATGVWDTNIWGLIVTNINKTKVKCTINFVRKEYKEELLHGSDPVLADNLIPVTIDNNGTVIKANTKEEWYSYGNKNWANAVILVDKSITYNVNDVIPEENIESYFVWIPKYSYQLWDLGNYTKLDGIEEEKEKPINIKFGTTDTSDNNTGECTTPMLSGESGNCQVGDYMTHPAFISMNTNGLWVGKFQSGYKGATSASAAQKNESDASKLQIKPDVYNWRNISLANMHLVSYNYQRELDSHMMKNTEWGAVAYLTNSIYGTCNGNKCNEVRINNASDYKTGYAAVHVPTTGYTNTNESCTTYPDNCNEYGESTSNLNETWNTSIGVLASTTSNISGIYDMNGNTYIYTMEFMLDSTGTQLIVGRNSAYPSGFQGIYGQDGGKNTTGIEIPNSKYYDLYKHNTSSTVYKNRILGDATGELGPFGRTNYKGNAVDATGSNVDIGSWYSDYASFITYSSPFFNRGGRLAFGTSNGLYSFKSEYGPAASWISFRLVLAI